MEARRLRPLIQPHCPRRNQCSPVLQRRFAADRWKNRSNSCCFYHPLHGQDLGHEAIELVEGRGRVERPALFCCPDRPGDDHDRVAPGDVAEQIVVARGVEELRLHGAGADGGDRDALRPQLVGKTAGERGNIRLGRAVDRHAGRRAEGRDGRDVDDLRPARHERDDGLRHHRERADIEVDHAHHIGGRRRGADIARGTAAGIIDQQPHVGFLLRQLFAEIAEAFGVEQVQAHADEFLFRELLGQLFELAHAAGDEPELFDVGKFAHELARELRAETGGRAGDDGRGHPRP